MSEQEVRWEYDVVEIGQEGPPIDFEVTEELIARYATAVRNDNPAYQPLGAGEAGDSDSKRRHLRFSCRPASARISQLAGPVKSGTGQAAPNAFTQYLRAHIDGARISNIRLKNDDRQLSVHLVAKDAEFDLLLSILGPRSNLYLLDGRGLLVASLRPLSDTRPELKLGTRWKSPEKSTATLRIRFSEYRMRKQRDHSKDHGVNFWLDEKRSHLD